MDPVSAYANKVLRNREPACTWVKRACQRHLDDLDRSDIYFDTSAAGLVLDFARMLPHVQGELRGQSFEPHPAQMFILGSIFGWKNKSNDKRRYRYAYIELPRKNAKSYLCSVIGLYGLLLDGEGGAEIYSVATKLDQAKKVWDVSKMMVKATPDLAANVKAFHNSLIFERTDSKYQPLASDSNTLDGLNPHFAVCDELHAWPNRDLWDVIQDGLGARVQPLMVAITTAGHNRNGICFEQRNHVIDILNHGTTFDDRYFGYIATTDKGDDWTKPRSWRKANPLLGTAKSLDYMEDQCQQASQMPSKLNAFLNKQLDQWTQVQERWLDVDKWAALKSEKDLREFEGRKCVAGVDLSSVSDLTAVVYLFEDEGSYFALPQFFLPEDTIHVRKSAVPYDLWSDQGFLTATPGNVVDYNFVREHLSEMQSKFDIEEVAVDPHNATQFSNDLNDDGFNVVLVAQNYTNLSAPTKELERLYLAGDLTHSGCPVLQWCLGNVVLRMGPSGNVLPDKAKSTEKIDGAAALITALARYLVRETPTPSVYESRGPRVIR